MLKRPELSRKEIKILEHGLKIRLSARLCLRKLKKGVQNAPEHESAVNTQEYHLALLECRSALSKCRMAPLRAKAQLSSSDDKAHPFWLIRRKTCPDSYSTRHCLFFKHSSLYKQRLDLKIQQTLWHSFTLSKRHFLTHSKFSSPSLTFSQARVFRF